MEIRLLGELEVVADDGVPLTVNGPMLRSALAALALHGGRPVPVSEIAAELWPGAPPAGSRALVRGYAHRLRKALPPGRVLTARGAYQLVLRPEETDVGRFRQALDRARALAPTDPAAAARLLDGALALWRGTPLADVRACPLRARERERLAALRRAAERERAALPSPAAPTAPAPDAAGGLLSAALDRLGASHHPGDRLAAAVFPLLGVAEVRGYGSGSVAALAGCAPRAAAEALERMARAGLVTLRPGPGGGYRLADAQRALAARGAAGLPDARRRGHLEGLACWYLGSLYRVNLPLALPGQIRARYHEGADRFPQGRLFTSVEESLPWADVTLEDVLRFADQLAGPGDDTGSALAGRPLADFALEAVRALESYFAIRLRWRGQRRLSELALRVAQRRGDRFGEAFALWQLGKVSGQRDEGARAVELVRRSVEIFRALGEEREALGALGTLVPCLGIAGRPAEAARTAERALALTTGPGLEEFRVLLQCNLGRCRLELGQHTEAHRLLADAYATARLPYSRTATAGTLAEYHLKTGAFQQAARWADRALGHAAEGPFDPYLMARQRGLRAAALRGLGRAAQARVEETQARALLEDLNRREDSRLRIPELEPAPVPPAEAPAP